MSKRFAQEWKLPNVRSFFCFSSTEISVVAASFNAKQNLSGKLPENFSLENKTEVKQEKWEQGIQWWEIDGLEDVDTTEISWK